MKNKNSGFTIVELFVTITISLGIVATIALLVSVIHFLAKYW